MVKSLGRVLASCAVMALSEMAGATISIQTVPVGDLGNAADTEIMWDRTSGYGRVDYAYNIGKYEVTAGQYTAFLNAVGGTDTYALYNTDMSNTIAGSGITRNGSSGSYTYSVAPDFANRPVNYVSFWDAARFTNWLHNGQPTGAQNDSTTENGAYTLTPEGISANTVSRNAGWRWAVTSEDEWYKAAYYKAGGTNAGYWVYPTRSNVAPGRDMADASGNNANYYWLGATPYPIDLGKYTTVAGAFQNSVSGYNTLDQGGNVWEWNDSALGGWYHGLRGGSFNYDTYDSNNLQSAGRNSYGAANEIATIGFRVSQVPMPTGLAMSALGLASLLTRRRRAVR